MIDHLLTAVRCVLGKTSVPQIDLLRANEALKSFFNVFCHFHGEVEAINKEKSKKLKFHFYRFSVNRMIKYVGFGHSAGHLANLGLLGQINQPKHASDSEDSETEDYNKVKDCVNPVTGAMYPPDHGSALAGMSDEQKEYEAMKLVDAMNKMMETGE
ncbi:hypothetical protein CRE_26910, partial [Caenorhabditis remanei]